DGNDCSIVIQFPRKDTFRFRFNPGKTGADYTRRNTRSVVQDTFDELKRFVETKDNFQVVVVKEDAAMVELETRGNEMKPEMRLVVTLKPFNITVFNA